MLMKLSVGSRDGQGGGEETRVGVGGVVCSRWVGGSVKTGRGGKGERNRLLSVCPSWGAPPPPLLSSIRLSGPKGREKKKEKDS